ncbi:kinase-like protein [Polychaeton citri CBS 116435]|uniref:Kinase-like protein n=1 Tax=Polychaeton citri CBS 116435 TaxID=1314669 RepID=A0A9P4QIG1_9PEZI|nr:kinase-like protein [Polychaeton citri CBS 116435]
MLGKQKSIDELDLDQIRQPRKPLVKTPSNRRLSGRLNIPTPELKSLTHILDSAQSTEGKSTPESEVPSSQHHYHSRHVDALLGQVSTWIKDEKNRRAVRRANKRERNATPSAQVGEDQPDSHADFAVDGHDSDSDASASLTKLESILKNSLGVELHRHRKPSLTLRHRPSLKKLHSRKPSAVSDDGADSGEYFGVDILVPSCDAVLDNSKTLSYPAAINDISDTSDDEELARTMSFRNKDAWSSFKFEILRSVHTLRLKGWRKVPLEMSDDISVERLCGALTNAVYVVAPPDELPPRPTSSETIDTTSSRPRKPPPKLLLRIYGPQVEHLIDRESELQILKRLARKNIGPRLLGTFENGRFEEYLHAKPLTPEELRNPDTSRQIAKRMRELHEGVELLEDERDAGAFVWRNWDKWVERVEQVVCWLDEQVKTQTPDIKLTGLDAWKRRGLICGVEWPVFKKTVEKYRVWLEEQHGGSQKIREQLVFAHNDTQYGNILRIVSTKESPLLLPANSHKQLVVIDFEYANANTPGLEFANHFTEWCYNYHEKKSYACNTSRYPTPEEQDRFLTAYLRHHSKSAPSTPSGNASPTPTNIPGQTADKPRRPASMISDYMADARNPLVSSPQASSRIGERAENSTEQGGDEEQELSRLKQQTRLWRMANSAQWVAWGIVQAKVPGLPSPSPSPDSMAPRLQLDPIAESIQEDLKDKAEGHESLASGEIIDAADAEEQEEEFDYLGYAQHRAMFFWGDAIQHGLIKPEDLPVETREKVKTVPY